MAVRLRCGSTGCSDDRYACPVDLNFLLVRVQRYRLQFVWDAVSKDNVSSRLLCLVVFLMEVVFY